MGSTMYYEYNYDYYCFMYVKVAKSNKKKEVCMEITIEKADSVIFAAIDGISFPISDYKVKTSASGETEVLIKIKLNSDYYQSIT